MPQNPQKVGGEVARLQHPAAAQEEVENRPGKDGQYHIDAHLSALGGHRVPEEGGGHHQPEEEIQGAPHQPQAHPHPDHPEHVVEQAQSAPQEDGLEQSIGLLLQRNPHGYRKSRASSPPPFSRPLSS